MSDQQEIERADDGFFEALNEMFAGNVKPMENLWSHADDVIYMGPVPELFHVGWKVTDLDWITQAKAHLSGTIEVVKRHMTLGHDLAVAHHIAEVSGQGPDQGALRMRGTNVFRKEQGQWKLISHHSDPLPYLKV
ncbi:MAG: nuclear transport factor 2 family protein [Pseudomonadota bacterium]